ncbi:MAG: hypothetical protein ACOYBH_07810 [Candidatus Alectryocaccobium sp.]|jgi:hypothetical protein
MVVSEIITIGDKQYKHTYSDSGCYIENEGVFFSNALESINSDRVFIETELQIKTDDTKIFDRDELENKAALSNQVTINSQQDDMLTEIFEIILGGAE